MEDSAGWGSVWVRVVSQVFLLDRRWTPRFVL